MEYVLDQSFLPERFFEEVTRHPHGSFHEKPLSDYLVSFAQQHGLRYKQYPNWNVIIYKDASAGYENHPPVMLQAHIDMVCEKEPGCTHDFSKDPIPLYVENGYVRAKGTTLGADDGVGVAYILSFLHDDSIPHPPLECAFTVQEEVGCNGGRELDFGAITAKRMIGLDDMGGTSCYISSCGSQRITAEKTFEMSDAQAPCYRLRADGLLGGHSGPCISEEKANALKLISRVLLAISKKHDIQLAGLNGGGKDNTIPIECEAVFASTADEAELQAEVKACLDKFKNEFLYSDPDIRLELKPCGAQKVMSADDSRSFIHYFFQLPNGFRHKSVKIEGLTTASENLANVATENGKITLKYFYRAELDSNLEEMRDEIQLLSDLYGVKVSVHSYSPGWQYREHSDVRDTLFAAYRDVTGRELTPIAVHGGLEAGFISAGIPGIDIATCGPHCEDYHTPRENLDLASFHEIYEVLKETLRRM